MKKIIIVLSIFLTVTLSGCTKNVKEDFVLERPADLAVVLNDVDYSEYLKLSNPVVTISVKDIGEMKLQLFPDLAPNTVNSLILYAQEGRFDGNNFHRVLNDFIIQAGDIPGTCQIPGEMSLRHSENTLQHYRGVISMARVGNLMDSASSQFFIVQKDAHHLDTQYAAFGGLVDGFEVLDYIASLEVAGTELPITDIIIESMTVELNGYEVGERICVD